ncbi:hypothetical protein PIROE2DRAFT_19601 [Piromyces sp. E2]|nr:hypothetical protein PIROE2DRAFT_19601 [Piromyces sp. E2]|eukprot:OUM69768.1 hypothetical protein PIROE2DRAFT_19601 [Piromyces sp. E2]
MFSKKILSIVALLFLGHQVSRVSAENCVISSSDGDKNCNVDTADGCTKGFVIAKSVSKFNYAYNKDSPASGDNEILIEITGDNNACNVKTSPGYYTDGTNHYSVNYNLAVAPVGEESSCDGNAGKFKTGGTAFCVASGKELGLDDGKKYLFTDADTILTKNAANNVILKSDANSITLDKEAMEYNYNYCVDSNAVVWDRKADLCNDEKAGECTYYSCASGTCTENTKNIPPTNEKRMGDCDLANPNENCGEGDYYLYGKDDTTKAKITTVTGGTFVLVQCVTDQETKKCKIPSAIPTGYLVNAGVGEGNAKYIKCNGRVCEPVASITDARISEISPGINMISINSDEFLGVYQDSGKYITVVKDATGNVIVEQGNTNIIPKKKYFITMTFPLFTSF